MFELIKASAQFIIELMSMHKSSSFSHLVRPTQLTSLNLSACHLHADAVLCLAVTLRHNAHLHKVNLSRNPLRSTAAVARLVVLLRGVLHSLDLSECDIATEEDVLPLAQVLCHSLVRTVSLVKNPLEVAAVRPLPPNPIYRTMPYVVYTGFHLHFFFSGHLSPHSTFLPTGSIALLVCTCLRGFVDAPTRSTACGPLPAVCT